MSAVDILGVRVDNVTAQETLAQMSRWVASGETHQVVTVNPEFVMRAQRDEAFRVVLREASLALPDGYGLLWAAKVLSRPLRERVAGSDLVPLVAALAARSGYRLFLLGAGPGVAERAAQVLVSSNPGLRIVGTFAGSPAAAEEEALVIRIRQAAPDFLFVAYGAPSQDLWIARNLARLGVPVCMGVGGTLDFIAGIATRAPVWMRNAGLEWLFRLWQEPWRWRRMLALPQFVLAVLRQSLLGVGRG
jgi:N-acetylglucosaminyldiphosphoundecaprenol N-acetyl-beta-D-mannosaminyltransferase